MNHPPSIFRAPTRNPPPRPPVQRSHSGPAATSSATDSRASYGTLPVTTKNSFVDFKKPSPRPDPSHTTRKRPREEPSSHYSRPAAHKKIKEDHYFSPRIPLPAPWSPGSTPRATPPSPLFFSNTPEQRPSIPARLSSSEAGARMLTNAQGEEKNVKTVSLARGSVTHRGIVSPGTPERPHRRSRSSVSRITPSYSSYSESPPSGAQSRHDAWKVLADVGITELLEQDSRYSFIIDLQDASNYESPGLSIIFANSPLRSERDLLDRLTRVIDPSTDHGQGPPSLPQFKTWIFGISSELNSLAFVDKSPSPFTLAGVSWSYTTLRKRLRVINGAPQSDSAEVAALSDPSLNASKSPLTPMLSDQAISTGEPRDSAGVQDYFDIPLPSKDAIPVPTQSESLLEQARDTVASSTPVLTTTETVFESLELTKTLTGQSSGDVEAGFFDWTRLPVSDAMPEHIKFARSIDWAATPLGPIEEWHQDLRQMCNLIMASPHPAAMYWGDNLVAIYNEAYVIMAGQKHPKLMGQSYRDAWAEIWDQVEPVFAQAQVTGQATMKDDDRLFINRSGHLEEAFFSWSIIPLVGSDGSVMGLYNPAFEKSRRKIAERRMLTLREIGERCATARDVKAFWEQLLIGLEANEYDLPFVMLYSLHGEVESDDSSVHSLSMSGSRQCYLEGALGVPSQHAAAPETADLQGSEGFATLFREVMKTNKPQYLDATKGDIPQELIDGLGQRGFTDPLRSVVVCPIHPTTGESTLGFLVMGVNPRRPYDEDYELFVQLLSRQLATSLASVVLFEEEIKRGQKAAKLAALDRIELSEQLAARTQEAIESETKFTRMAEFAPVGMFIADSLGLITYANDTWYEISRVPRGKGLTDRWFEYIVNDDQTLLQQLWHDLVDNKKAANAELRFKAPWVDRNGLKGPTWILFSAYPEKTEEGALKSIFGSITNISQQKWAESIQREKMEEAVELKRQQENFIDVTSHEMRNPLSAILQCADEIVTSLKAAKPDVEASGVADSLVDDNVDAAQTISLCAQHQKRIVDDILTMSKLDSALLMVTPVDVQPQAIVQKALKMFEGEVQTASLQMNFIVDASFKNLGVDWVKFDPSRVLQVLINLTTNAVKFTREKKGSITITIAASRQKPSEDDKTIVSYFTSRSKREEHISGPDWGDGEVLYIHFAVRDTGRGLSSEEKKLLFMRFSQASPRTHVQYGGSGLGLFISRELTELQGGEIGVASEEGKGSTFAFYVKARRSTAPPKSALDSIIPTTSTNIARRTSSVNSRSGIPRASPSRQTQSENGAGGPVRSAPIPERGRTARGNTISILIVEDNLVNQRVLQKQLKNAGFITHVANHGGEALDKLTESWFWASDGAQNRLGNGEDRDATAEPITLDVVLMDQEMPVMDGLTCTKKIRELESQGSLVRHVPVIAVTANARVEQVKTAMEAGMDDVVSKPFRIPDLIPKIEELIARYEG